MNAIHIKRKLTSDTLHLPELQELIGQDVEIFVMPEREPFVCLETEETFLGLAPPPPTPEEHARNMAELREMAKTDERLARFLEAVERQDIDVAAVIRARGVQG